MKSNILEAQNRIKYTFSAISLATSALSFHLYITNILTAHHCFFIWLTSHLAYIFIHSKILNKWYKKNHEEKTTKTLAEEDKSKKEVIFKFHIDTSKEKSNSIFNLDEHELPSLLKEENIFHSHFFLMDKLLFQYQTQHALLEKLKNDIDILELKNEIEKINKHSFDLKLILDVLYMQSNVLKKYNLEENNLTKNTLREEQS